MAVGAIGTLVVLITLLLSVFTGDIFTPGQAVGMFLLLAVEIVATACGSMYLAYLVEETNVFNN